MEIQFLYETKIDNHYLPNGMSDELNNQYITALKNDNLENFFINFQLSYKMTFPYTSGHDIIREEKYRIISEFAYNDSNIHASESMLYMYHIATGGNMSGGLNETELENFPSYIENIPDFSKNLIRTKKNVFLYINQQQEKIAISTFRKLYKECLEQKIPLDKVFVSSDNFNFEEIYNTLLEEDNIKLNIKFFNYPWALYQAAEMLDYLHEEKNIVTKIKYQRDKKILCFNRHLRENKIIAVSYLLLNNYEKDSHLSFNIDFIHDGFQDKYIFEKVRQGYNKLIEQKKSVIDYDVTGDGSFLYDDKNLYESSYISLVTETEFNDGRITEKTFKPIINLHPFILWGPPMALEYLKYYNFKTFSKYIDESYDDVDEEYSRYEKLFKIIDFIAKMNTMELDNFTEKISDILIYNRNLLEQYKHDNMLADFEENIVKIVDNSFTNRFKSIINPKTI